MTRRVLGPCLMLAALLAPTRPADGQGASPTSPGGPAPVAYEPFFLGRPMAPARPAMPAGGGCPYPYGPCSCGDEDGGLLGVLLAPLEDEEDPDGPISTDRPTFTPVNATVPAGRVIVETGYTYTHDLTATERRDDHLFPELAVRVGLNDWLELRTFWGGQLYSSTKRRFGPGLVRADGQTDMTAGFKTLITEQDGLIPQTALITDVSIPLGGGSPGSADGVDPVIFLLYGWSIGEKFTLLGSTSYTSLFSRATALNPAHDSFERFAQSLAGYYSATDELTLFYEYYVLAYTNAESNLPDHFMDGGLLYLITPNLQFDLRAGFGLADRSDDFFAGTGLSWRY